MVPKLAGAAVVKSRKVRPSTQPCSGSKGTERGNDLIILDLCFALLDLNQSPYGEYADRKFMLLLVLTLSRSQLMMPILP